MTRFGLALIAFAGLAMTACEEAPPPRPPEAVRPKAEPKPEVAEKKADPAPSYVYSYNPLGKRDPFRSTLLDQVRTSSQGSSPCSEPLCAWDLEQLMLVAVVSGDANPIAMVEDPQGRGYVVKRNSRMGKQGGRVSEILRDSITVTEFWSDPTGKVIPKPTQKMIKDEKNVVPALDLVSGKTFE